MNTTELIAAVAEGTGKSKEAAKQFVEVFADLATQLLKAGEPVEIRGFGKFEARTVEGRKGRNPRTGEAIDIAASKSVKFKPASALKEAVRRS